MPSAAAESIKQSYRVTRIEVVDSGAAPSPVPGQPPQSVGAKKVLVTCASLGADPTQPEGIPHTWEFGDVAAASAFFNVDEAIDIAFTKSPQPAE